MGWPGVPAGRAAPVFPPSGGLGWCSVAVSPASLAAARSAFVAAVAALDAATAGLEAAGVSPARSADVPPAVLAWVRWAANARGGPRPGPELWRLPG